MPTRSHTRLNVYPTSDPLRFAWSLLRIRYSTQGIPDARLVEHGTVDLQDPDLVGIEAVAALLTRAAHPEA